MTDQPIPGTSFMMDDAFRARLNEASELERLRGQLKPQHVRPVDIYAMQWLEFSYDEPRGSLMEEMMIAFCGHSRELSYPAFSDHHPDRPDHMRGFFVFDDWMEEYKPVPHGYWVVRLFPGRFDIYADHAYKAAFTSAGEVLIR